MIVNVCASSITREPIFHQTSYSKYYYTDRQPLTRPSKPSPKREQRKKPLATTKSLPTKFEKKCQKLLKKLRSLIVSKFAKLA
ncbi:hypothetical protein ANCCAN_23806 [Ancylostoma caninum]|uniref:Uncharacterized protein n=1 Tax=Ancylostoma caninum TaxID=29170 RepID=A0A368FE52_ANCCA|nr:hypothetical protein ANCCAN_23806 [Ancylostoma caninum]